MAKNKTAETSVSVTEFINAVKEDAKRKDSLTLIELIKEQTGRDPEMWGPSIVGFGSYHYKYESGHEANSPLVGFSPRAAALALYLSGHFENREGLLNQLGKYKTDKSCIYIKNSLTLIPKRLKKWSQIMWRTFRKSILINLKAKVCCGQIRNPIPDLSI